MSLGDTDRHSMDSSALFFKSDTKEKNGDSRLLAERKYAERLFCF